MALGMLLLEFALLGFIAAAYFQARRCLTAAAARERVETAESLREVQETVTGLIAVLQARAAEIENRLDERAAKIEQLISALDCLTEQQSRSVTSRRDAPGPPQPRVASARTVPGAIEQAMQLIADGETPLSAARQTALTVTEVEMAARMRGLTRQQ